jgi:hypothetical protein
MKIISGGQTGADRAALDAAIGLGLPYGGWVPKGGLAEDFPHAPGLLGKYPKLREAATSDPAERTQLNVRDSGATLVFVTELDTAASPGTLLTEATARALGRPLLIVRADRPDAARSIKDWLRDLGHVNVLNIAGPRESEAPGIYALSREVLEKVLAP